MKFFFHTEASHLSTIEYPSDLSLIDFTLDQLVESDFHLGSHLNQFNKLNFNYVFSKRFNFLIINLAYSLYNLKLAVYFLSIIVSRRGKVLFYDGGFDSMRLFVKFIGLTSKQHAIGQQWIAGLLTNFKEFYPAVFTGISRHFRFPKVNFSGMRYIHRPPNVFCSLNIEKGSASFLENFRLGIPIIALVDLNISIAGLTFPIFSNSISANTHITFFSILRSAVLNGYKYEIYKFYRRSLKNILKVRYIRQLLKSRRLPRITILFNFRLILLRIIFDHFFIFFKFFKFLIYPLYPDSVNLYIPKLIEESFSEFYLKYPIFRKIMLDLFIQYLFPFFKNLFFFDVKAILDEDTKFNLKTFSFNDFLNIFVSFFRTEGSFLNFIFKMYAQIESSFFSTKLFVFFDIFLARIFPFLLFLFKSFLELDKTIKAKELAYFFKSLKILFFVFYRLRLLPFLDYLKLKYSTLHFHILYDYFPFFQYQKKRLPNVRLSFFSRFLRFKAPNIPMFVGFKFVSFENIIKLVSDFSKNYGFFSYLKFSKKCKRFMRRFSRSQKFVKFLFSSVHKRRRRAYFDFKTSQVIVLPSRFVKANEHKGFFKLRYVDTAYLMDSRSFTSHFLKKVRNKFNAFLLSFFDEEYDDAKFPLNNEFFYFQVGYGSAFLTRQYQRNKFLEFRKLSVQKGFDSKKKKVSDLLAKKFKNSRISFYFFFNVGLIKKTNK